MKIEDWNPEAWDGKLENYKIGKKEKSNITFFTHYFFLAIYR
jgi:hypothetical protein